MKNKNEKENKIKWSLIFILLTWLLSELKIVDFIYFYFIM